MGKLKFGDNNTINYKHIMVDKPVLESPSISYTTTSYQGKSYSWFYVVSPTSNGTFFTTFRLFSNGNAIYEDKNASASSKNSWYPPIAIVLPLLSNGLNILTATVFDENGKMLESPKSIEFHIVVSNLKYELENLTADLPEGKITQTTDIKIQLTPAEGFYLPDDIIVLMNGEIQEDVYDNQTGVISIYADGDIEIKASAKAENSISAPKLALSKLEDELEISLYPGAKNIEFYDEDENLIYSMDLPEEPFIENYSKYKFVWDETLEGYTNENTSINYSYAIARICFNVKEDSERKLVINAGKIDSNYSSQLVVGKLDTVLDRKYTVDSSSKYLYNTYAGTKEIIIENIDLGYHFIEVKIGNQNIAGSSNKSGSCVFKFTLS